MFFFESSFEGVEGWKLYTLVKVDGKNRHSQVRWRIFVRGHDKSNRWEWPAIYFPGGTQLCIRIYIIYIYICINIIAFFQDIKSKSWVTNTLFWEDII